MKICFIGPSSSSHIQKWCNWFSTHGHEVHLISFTDDKVENANQYKLNISVDAHGSEFQKIKYLFTGHQINKLIKEINPDVVNVHYATSYGLAVALSGVKRYILSVWGADVYDFPKKSFIHKLLLKYSLKRASYIFSTSKAMACETSLYTKKHIDITPFGVDTDLFSPNKRTRNDDGMVVIGTVKALTDKYGIRNILEAVAIVREISSVPIRLRIAGKGPKAQEYKDLALSLKIDDITDWLGFISQEDAAIEWANMDIAVIPSTLESESFGVSAVEAEASGTAVIISDIPGLMEATQPNITSIVVKRNESKQLAESIISLINDRERIRSLGYHGREYALNVYSIDTCFFHIEELLRKYSEIN